MKTYMWKNLFIFFFPFSWFWCLFESVGEGERTSGFSICWFTPWCLPRLGLGQAQPGVWDSIYISYMSGQGSGFCPSSAAFLGALEGAWSEVEQVVYLVGLLWMLVSRWGVTWCATGYLREAENNIEKHIEQKAGIPTLWLLSDRNYIAFWVFFSQQSCVICVVRNFTGKDKSSTVSCFTTR